MAKHNTTLTEADIAATFRVGKEVVSTLLKDGNRVITPLTTYYVGAMGEIDSQMEDFTPAKGEKKHRLKLYSSLNRQWAKSVVENTKWKREERFDEFAPSFDAVETVDGAIANTVSPGGFLRITGRRLDITKTDTEQGVFFTAANGTKTRASVYLEVSPSLIILQVPQTLANGSYTISVSTHPDGKELKTTAYATAYTVMAFR